MTWLFLSVIFFLTALSANAGNIAVVTLAAGEDFIESVKPGFENKKKYCQKHGYDFISCNENLDPSRHPAWSKVLLIQQAFKRPDCKWVVWLDADTLIMNQGIPLENFIDEKYDLIIAHDFEGINSGVMFFRNCEWSKIFLDKVYTHTEFLNHKWYEQLGIVAETNKSENTIHIKDVPQRLFNSYPVETKNSLTSTYQNGDFLIHFAGQHGVLEPLFSKYGKLVIDEPNLPGLDQYLGIYGFSLSPNHSNNNEGYMTEKQREQFNEFLAQNQQIETMMEIGLNGGHSAENFIQRCKNLKKFTSFDICQHPYAPVAVDYMTHKYKSRFEFVKGDSMKTVPGYASQNPAQKFDLIYIDGNHSREMCMSDIVNCRSLAHPKTILLIDDYHSWIQEVVDSLKDKGLLEINKVHHSWDENGFRSWVEAKYKNVLPQN